MCSFIIEVWTRMEAGLAHSPPLPPSLPPFDSLLKYKINSHLKLIAGLAWESGLTALMKPCSNTW